MTDQEKKELNSAINGNFSDNYDELEIVLTNLRTAKEAATDHGRFKRIDNAIEKVRTKMHAMKA